MQSDFIDKGILLPIVENFAAESRSFGEALRKLSQNLGVSKEMKDFLRSSEVLSIIKRVLGFRNPPPELIRNKNWNKRTFYDGFMELRSKGEKSKIKRKFLSCWSCYRIYRGPGSRDFLLLDNAGEEINFLSYRLLTTTNYLVSQNGDGETINVYYKKIKIDLPYSKIEIDDEETFMIIETERGLIICVGLLDDEGTIGDIKGNTKVYLINEFGKKFIKTITGNISLLRQGSRGFYISSRGTDFVKTVLIDYFNGEEIAKIPFLKELNSETTISGFYKNIDRIDLMWKGPGFFYDNKAQMITWIFSDKFKNIDSFIFTDKMLLDVITGEPLLFFNFTIPESILVTRRDDESGYIIWVEKENIENSHEIDSSF